MPLVTAAVLAYAAGLLSGFGGAFVWTVGASCVVAWLGGRTARDHLAIAGMAVAGFAAATSARSARAECVDRLLTQTEWRVVLLGPASPGAFVRASHACGVVVRFAVSQGRAPTGAAVAARGTPATAYGGMLVTDVVVRVVRAPAALARWRARIGRGIDAAFGSQSQLVRALLIADRHDLSPTVRDRFAAAGMSHMLSVSGLHVGLIAAAVALLAQMFGLRRTAADVIVVSVTAFYVLLIGAPIPAVRAALMLGAYALSVAVQRPTSSWAVLAAGAGLPLIDPYAVLDLGYQLSMSGMVALVAAGALTRRWSWLGTRGWRGPVYRALMASTAATLLTAPLVASTFGRISIVAPLSNLAAVPVMAVLQPMLFLAAVLQPVPAAARFVADAAQPLLGFIDAIASVAAGLPGASLAVVADGATIALACTAATALVVAAVSRFPGRALLAAAACLAAIIWRPLVPPRLGFTELHVLDVGQGDAIALRTTRGRWVLFDAGRDWQGGDKGLRDVVPYLRSRGGPLVAFILSHPHSDHVGGAASTIRVLKPGLYFDPGYAGGSSSYRASLLAAQRAGTGWRRIHPGDSLVVDEATITFLAPDSSWVDSLRDPNEASGIARVRIGDVALLMTGDAEVGEERWLLANQSHLLRADVLKVAHHGSRTSSTPEFLAAVQPRLALVSVGAGNMYGHPNASVMQTLAAHGAITLRTDLHGTVVVRTDGNRIEVEAGGERWALRP